MSRMLPEESNLRTELEHIRAKDSEARKKADKKLKGASGFLKRREMAINLLLGFLNSSKGGIFDEASKPKITHSSGEDESTDSPSATIEEVSA